MHLKALRSLAEPGEGVGLLAAQVSQNGKSAFKILYKNYLSLLAKKMGLEANKQLEKTTNNEYIYALQYKLVQYNVKYLTILSRTLVVYSAKTCPPYATIIANLKLLQT